VGSERNEYPLADEGHVLISQQYIGPPREERWITRIERADNQIAIAQEFLRAVMDNDSHGLIGYAEFLDGYLIIRADNGTVVYRLDNELIDGRFAATKVSEGKHGTDRNL